MLVINQQCGHIDCSLVIHLKVTIANQTGFTVYRLAAVNIYMDNSFSFVITLLKCCKLSSTLPLRSWFATYVRKYAK